MCLSIFLQYTVKVEKGDYVLQLQVGNRDILWKGITVSFTKTSCTRYVFCPISPHR